MAATMANNASASAPSLHPNLEASTSLPITSVSADIANRNTTTVRGQITITWPYNGFKQTIIFGIADPQNRTSGHVRLRFRGPVAQAVVDAKLGAGDGIVLSLEGADIDKVNGVWDITVTKRVLLQINPSTGEQSKLVDFDDPTATPEDLQPVVPEINPSDLLLHQFASPTVATPSQKRSLQPDEYDSPAFLKRARVSYGSLFEGGLDIFKEEEARGRSKSKFGRPSGAWRYTSKSRSPEPERSPPPAERQKTPENSDHVATSGSIDTKSPSVTQPPALSVAAEASPVPIRIGAPISGVAVPKSPELRSPTPPIAPVVETTAISEVQTETDVSRDDAHVGSQARPESIPHTQLGFGAFSPFISKGNFFSGSAEYHHTRDANSPDVVTHHGIEVSATVETSYVEAATSVAPSWPTLDVLTPVTKSQAPNPFATPYTVASTAAANPFSSISIPGANPFAASADGYQYPELPDIVQADDQHNVPQSDGHEIDDEGQLDEQIYGVTGGPEDDEPEDDELEDDEDAERSHAGIDQDDDNAAEHSEGEDDEIYDEDDEIYNEDEDDYDMEDGEEDEYEEDGAYPAGDYEYVPDGEEVDDDDEEDEVPPISPISPGSLSPRFFDKPSTPVVINLLSDSDDEPKPKAPRQPSQGSPAPATPQSAKHMTITSSPARRSQHPTNSRTVSMSPAKSISTPLGSDSGSGSVSQPIEVLDGNEDQVKMEDDQEDDQQVQSSPVHAVDRILDDIFDPRGTVDATGNMSDQPGSQESTRKTSQVGEQRVHGSDAMDVDEEAGQEVEQAGATIHTDSPQQQLEADLEQSRAIEILQGLGAGRRLPSLLKDLPEKPQRRHDERQGEEDQETATRVQRAQSVESLTSSEGRITRSRRAQMVAEQESHVQPEHVAAAPPAVVSTTPTAVAATPRRGRKAAAKSASPEPDDTSSTPANASSTPAKPKKPAKGRRSKVTLELTTQTSDVEHQSPGDEELVNETADPRPPTKSKRTRKANATPTSALTPTTPTVSYSEMFAMDPSIQIAQSSVGPGSNKSTRSSIGAVSATPMDQFMAALSQPDPSVQMSKVSTPTRRSARLRDSSPAVEDAAPSETPDKASSSLEVSPAHQGKAASRSRSASAQPEDAAEPAAAEAPSGDQMVALTEAKLALSKDLRTNLPDMTSLKNVRYKPSGLVDVFCVATAAPADAQRQRSQQYLLAMTATDPQIAPSGVASIIMTRPQAQALPTVKQGDVLLLRKFKVQPGGATKPPTLRSTNGSSWAVFEHGRHDGLPQIKGPPLEWTKQEQEHAEGLGRWWDLLDARSMGRLGKAALKVDGKA